MQVFVYILANTKRGVMYVGVTTNVARRLAEHRSGIVPGFASRYSAIRLVHIETYNSMSEARSRERALKRWRRDWKFELIEQLKPGLVRPFASALMSVPGAMQCAALLRRTGIAKPMA